MTTRTDIRISLPSKGRMAEEAMAFLADCGLEVKLLNPRQYAARIPALPELTVLFQRPSDIVTSVGDGSVDLGVTGMDIVAERGAVHSGAVDCAAAAADHGVLIIHDALRFGQCRLALAVPEDWDGVETVADLARFARTLPHPLRVATKFPRLTGEFLTEAGIPFVLIDAEGTLEVAPAIGYADAIADLVSSGQTLRDNRLRPLADGAILKSQAVLIANRSALRERREVLTIAGELLESIEAHLRAVDHVAIYANVRGGSPEEIAGQLFAQETLGGLQGPTISRVVARDGSPNWYAVHIVVRRAEIFQAVAELRAIGGSGVVVTPVTYIFEEEPARYRAMMDAVRGAARDGVQS